MKKVFIVSAVLLLVVLIFLSIYNFAYRPKDEAVRPIRDVADLGSGSGGVSGGEPFSQAGGGGGEVGDGGNKPPVEEAVDDKIIPVTTFPVISPVIDEEQGVIRVYDKTNGKLKEIPVNGGAERTVDETELPNLVYAAWAPDRQKVLTKFVSGGRTNIYFYDHKLKNGVKLKDGIFRVDWTPNGDQILYLYRDSARKRISLNVAQPDGGNWRVLANNLKENMRFAGIPQSTRVILYDAPGPNTKTRLRMVSLIDRAPRPKTVFEQGYNADFLPSPTGEKILVSLASQRGSNERFLGLINSGGGNYQPLNIPTNVSKCTWSQNGKFIYCALPTGDQDTFWKINTITNEQERLIDLESITSSQTKYKAFNLMLAPDASALFFVNALDGKLYRISL